MPRPTKKAARKKTAPGLPSFVQIHFNDKEKGEVNSWIETVTIPASDLMLEMVDELAKVSVSYSENYDTYFASVTVSDGSVEGTRICYSVRYPDFVKSIQVLSYVYHHYVKNPLWVQEDTSDQSHW